MNEEHVYHEYASWKLDKHDFLQSLIHQESSLMLRFKHVFHVIEHLYTKMVDSLSYTEDELNIFQTGFYYLADQIDEIETILKKYFQQDVHLLEKNAKEVNLLLSTIEFQQEILGLEEFEQEDLDQLMDFEKQLIEKMSNQEPIPIQMFKDLDELTYTMFKRLKVDFYPIDDIYLEIADELGIIE
jgi:hypothetical protein